MTDTVNSSVTNKLQQHWKQELVKALLNNDVSSALSLRTDRLPTKLYKYSRIAPYLFESIEKHEWLLKDPSNFNDPYDSSLSVFDNEFRFLNGDMVGLMDLSFSKRKTRLIHKVAAERERKLNEEYRNKIKSSLKITCFSECNDSLLMWSHYASNHTGVCLEYNFKALDISDLRKRLMYPVLYSTSIFTGAQQILNRDNLSAFLAVVAALHKNSCWKYEKEWRLIVDGGTMPDEVSWRMPPVQRIFLGSRINKDDSEKILEIARTHNIPVLKATLLDTKYKLRYKPVYVG